MSDNFEEITPQVKDEIGCSIMGYQDVDVCIPITVKAFGEVGNAKTQCLGKSVISCGCDAVRESLERYVNLRSVKGFALKFL